MFFLVLKPARLLGACKPRLRANTDCTTGLHVQLPRLHQVHHRSSKEAWKFHASLELSIGNQVKAVKVKHTEENEKLEHMQ